MRGSLSCYHSGTENPSISWLHCPLRCHCRWYPAQKGRRSVVEAIPLLKKPSLKTRPSCPSHPLEENLVTQSPLFSKETISSHGGWNLRKNGYWWYRPSLILSIYWSMRAWPGLFRLPFQTLISQGLISVRFLPFSSHQ